MAQWFCTNCDDPIIGAVSEGLCVCCLLDQEGSRSVECDHCLAPISPYEEGFADAICQDCQEELDNSELNPEDDDLREEEG